MGKEGEGVTGLYYSVVSMNDNEGVGREDGEGEKGCSPAGLP